MATYKVKIWRQSGPNSNGLMERHVVKGIDGDMSFLEMLDHLNEDLEEQGKEPVATARLQRVRTYAKQQVGGAEGLQPL